jgi:hypothetical protein
MRLHMLVLAKAHDILGRNGAGFMGGWPRRAAAQPS